MNKSKLKKSKMLYFSNLFESNDRGGEMPTVKVFLGGTCNESTWREKLIPKLEENNIDYFNPVVDDWNEEARKREIIERQTCDYCLYTITPKMTGVYSIAEVTDDSNKRPDKTIFCLLRRFDGKSFDTDQWKSLLAVSSLVKNNGAHVCFSLDDIIEILRR